MITIIIILILTLLDLLFVIADQILFLLLELLYLLILMIDQLSNILIQIILKILQIYSDNITNDIISEILDKLIKLIKKNIK